MSFKTEYEFVLPRGYVDAEGNVHREGVMRLANAKDEIIPAWIAYARLRRCRDDRVLSPMSRSWSAHRGR